MVIIAKGDRIRHFTVKPWLAGMVGGAVAVLAVGYLFATTYLVVRDDLLNASVARQARLQQAYEDRMSALRVQVDRMTSEKLLDQQLMESKVSELIRKQSQLTRRHGQLEPILERANELVPSPEVKSPDKQATLSSEPVVTAASIAALWQTRSAMRLESDQDEVDNVFVAISHSLRSIEEEQIEKVESLSDTAYQTADAIKTALESAGLTIDADFGKDDVGGPLLAVDPSQVFEAKVRELDSALQRLDDLKASARKLPIANPVPGRPVSSSFGIRRDPIIGRPALHSGMDFRAGTGTPAHATAPGRVTRAGWAGGYGRMVEVDHGGGLTTRYAHLSKITVSRGEKVDTGDQLGLVGSSGRSTGPHLHYEIRKNQKAIDPLRFIKVGRKVDQVLVSGAGGPS